MAEWWLEVDREREQEAFRELIPNGGCLVLVGEDQSGCSAVARLLASRATDFGYEAFGVSRVRRNTSVKQLLLSAWELAAPQPPQGVVRRWRVPGPRLALDEVIEELGGTLKTLATPPLLLFDTPDRHDRLLREEARAFPEVAHAAGCPVLVTSRKESGTPWPRKPDCSVITLADFTREDVLKVLMANPRMHRHSLDDLVRITDMVTGGDARVSPEIAYTRLYAWGKGEREPR